VTSWAAFASPIPQYSQPIGWSGRLAARTAPTVANTGALTSRIDQESYGLPCSTPSRIPTPASRSATVAPRNDPTSQATAGGAALRSPVSCATSASPNPVLHPCVTVPRDRPGNVTGQAWS